MKKYAFFLSLTDNYVYLFNALLNSVELFGMGEWADVVVLHDDSVNAGIIDFYRAKTEALSVDVKFVRIDPMPEDEGLGKVLTVKYYRYRMMAQLGVRYDAICFTDTDIYFTSSVREYFDIAAGTDLIVGVNDNVVRHYRAGGGPSSPAWADSRVPFFSEDIVDVKFICNVPTFIDMRKYGALFEDVFQHRSRLGMDNTWPFTGDLETMNIVFNKHGVKAKLMVLPSYLWTGVHYSIYRVSTAVRQQKLGALVKLSDPSYRRQALFVSDTQEHVRAFHGRDWTTEHNERRIKDHNIPKLLGQMEGDFSGSVGKAAVARRVAIYDEIQAYLVYLEFDCFVSIEDLVKVVRIEQLPYLQGKHTELASKIAIFKE